MGAAAPYAPPLSQQTWDQLDDAVHVRAPWGDGRLALCGQAGRHLVDWSAAGLVDPWSSCWTCLNAVAWICEYRAQQPLRDALTPGDNLAALHRSSGFLRRAIDKVLDR